MENITIRLPWYCHYFKCSNVAKLLFINMHNKLLLSVGSWLHQIVMCSGAFPVSSVEPCTVILKQVFYSWLERPRPGSQLLVMLALCSRASNFKTLKWACCLVNLYLHFQISKFVQSSFVCQVDSSQWRIVRKKMCFDDIRLLKTRYWSN